MPVDIEKATVFHWLYEQAKKLYMDIERDLVASFPDHVAKHFPGKKVAGLEPWEDSWKLNFDDGSYIVFSKMETICAWKADE
jgi:hypothetical protein